MKRYTFSSLPELHHKTIILDIDGTLVYSGSYHLSPSVIEAVKHLAKTNQIFLYSNSQGTERDAHIAGVLGVEYIDSPYKKPSKKALSMLKIDSPLVVIGDKLLTDGVLAKRLGATFYHFHRTESIQDSTKDKFLHFIEDTLFFFISAFYLMRPWQWTKNLLILAPLFFAKEVFHTQLLSQSLASFFSFSLVASAVYALNDSLDATQDRLHPKKQFRPIAAKALTTTQGLSLSLVLFIAGISLSTLIPDTTPYILAYTALMLSYSLWLKHIAIIDALCIAFGFVLRVLIGGIAASVTISSWIILCTFFLALFLVFGKRLSEYRHSVKRKVLENYNESILFAFTWISATMTLMTYSIWSMIGVHSSLIVFSVIPVFYAIFQILMLIEQKNAEEPDTFFYHDKSITLAFVCWIAYLSVILY